MRTHNTGGIQTLIHMHTHKYMQTHACTQAHSAVNPSFVAVSAQPTIEILLMASCTGQYLPNYCTALPESSTEVEALTLCVDACVCVCVGVLQYVGALVSVCL